MKKHYALPLFLAAILVVVFAAIAGSGRNSTDVPAPPAIGTVIDDFTLPDADGKDHALKSMMSNAKGAVILFVATKCPVSNAYNERMEKLYEDYKAKGIVVIGINANNTEPAAEVKSHAADKGLKFAILKDDGNKIADRLGATRTPEAYVLDASMKLVYHGRIDNSQKIEGITSNDLREALDELLAGKAITKTGGAAFGCTIKRVS
jgi:peroxiredoxin